MHTVAQHPYHVPNPSDLTVCLHEHPALSYSHIVSTQGRLRRRSSPTSTTRESRCRTRETTWTSWTRCCARQTRPAPLQRLHLCPVRFPTSCLPPTTRALCTVACCTLPLSTCVWFLLYTKQQTLSLRFFVALLQHQFACSTPSPDTAHYRRPRGSRSMRGNRVTVCVCL